MSETNETNREQTATSHSYAPGTILGTKWGLVEVQSDGSHRPVFAADVEGRPRTEADVAEDRDFAAWMNRAYLAEGRVAQLERALEEIAELAEQGEHTGGAAPIARAALGKP